MHRGLRLTAIFKSYEHELEAYYRALAPTEACLKSNFLFVTLSCGLRSKLSNRMISRGGLIFMVHAHSLYLLT